MMLLYTIRERLGGNSEKINSTKLSLQGKDEREKYGTQENKSQAKNMQKRKAKHISTYNKCK